MKAEKKGAELVLYADAMNEATVVAAAMISPEFRGAISRHAPDVFLVPEHKIAHQALREAHKRGLGSDPATLSRLSNGEVNVAYLAELLASRPDLPAPQTLKFALEQLLWDKARHTGLTGPVNSLLEAIQKGEEPARVQGLARAVAASFDGWSERKYLLDPEELVRRQVSDIRLRMLGRNVYPFGLKGLDFYEAAPGQDEKTARRRILPGAAPGRVTMITGQTGSGKSTVTARLVLGLARQKRKVLYGSWEKSGGMTLELLACMSLCWSRADLMEGRINDAELTVLAQKMEQLSVWVRFMANPFRRVTGERLSNERNLDIVHGYIADSGCEVFIADLFERCLVADEPSEEKRALFRLQAMTEELDVHTIAVAQQKKDVATRNDKHPTEEGIKGSGAWAEVADNIFGVYRQYQWKAVPDNTLEIDVLKQRDSRGMLAVEFDWDADRGMISGGRTIDYERPSFGGQSGNKVDSFMREPRKKDK
jgi:replicative DNA helicase